jgi:amino acid transporter
VSETTGLRRIISLPLLVYYGLGNILGAGIYALVGKVAGAAGMFAPVSFLIASLMAVFSAFSYAELSSRYPYSAGESVYVFEGFGRRGLSLFVGILLVTAGILSSAAIIQSFAAYLSEFVQLPRYLVLTVSILLLAMVAAWGILESVRVAALMTLLELVGLVLIVWVGGDRLVSIPARTGELLPPLDAGIWYGILFGALLAFYAYLGFEDMVNIAEEVRKPRRNMPLAIIIVLIVSAVLYMLVALTAVLNVAPDQLRQSDAPLALIYRQATGREATVISLIGLFAVTNGALIQMIMASRVLYGLSSRGWLPPSFSVIHKHTKTPLLATLVIAGGVLLSSFLRTLEQLAEMTSMLILAVFVLVNLSLIVIKKRQPLPEGARSWPLWVPVAGLLTSSAMLAFGAVRYLL